MNRFRLSLGQLFLATTLIACGCAIIGYLARSDQEFAGQTGLRALMGVDGFAFIGGGIGGLFRKTRAGILVGAALGICMMMIMALGGVRIFPP